jgi:hypothetical protein
MKYDDNAFSSALLRAHINEAKRELDVTDDFELEKMIRELKDGYVSVIEQKLLSNEMELELTLQQIRAMDKNPVVKQERLRLNLDDIYLDEEQQPNDEFLDILENRNVSDIQQQQQLQQQQKQQKQLLQLQQQQQQQKKEKQPISNRSDSSEYTDSSEGTLEDEFMRLRMQAARSGNPQMFANVVKMEKELAAIRVSDNPIFYAIEDMSNKPVTPNRIRDVEYGSDPSFKHLYDNIQKQLKLTEDLVQQNEEENSRIAKEIRNIKERGSHPPMPYPPRQPTMLSSDMFHNMPQQQQQNMQQDSRNIPDDSVGRQSSNPSPVPVLAQPPVLQEDEELKKLRLDHQKELEKLKYEQEKLQHEKELEEFRAKLERDKLEQQKQDDERKYKDQIEEQRRIARLRREQAKDAGFMALNQGATDADLAKQGMQLYFDYTIGLPTTTKSIALVYAIYDVETLQLKAPIRKTSICEADFMHESPFEIGNSQEPTQFKQGIFLIRRQYPREILTNPRPMKLIVEILSITQSGVQNEPPKADCLAWTMIYLVNLDLKLNEGLFRLPVFRPHVNASLRPNQLDQYYKRLQFIEIFIRIVAPDNFRRMEMFPVSPDTQEQYVVPDILKPPKFVPAPSTTNFTANGIGNSGIPGLGRGGSSPSPLGKLASRGRISRLGAPRGRGFVPTAASAFKLAAQSIVNLKIQDLVQEDQGEPEVIIQEPTDIPAIVEPTDTNQQVKQTGSGINSRNVSRPVTSRQLETTMEYEPMNGVGVSIDSCTNLKNLSVNDGKQYFIRIVLLYGETRAYHPKNNVPYLWETSRTSTFEDEKSVTVVEWNERTLFRQFLYQKNARILFQLFVDCEEEEEEQNQYKVEQPDSERPKSTSLGEAEDKKAHRKLLFWKAMQLFVTKSGDGIARIRLNEGIYNLRLDKAPMDLSTEPDSLGEYDLLPSLTLRIFSKGHEPAPTVAIRRKQGNPIFDSPSVTNSVSLSARDLHEKHGLVVCLDGAEDLPENVLITRVVFYYFSKRFAILGQNDIVNQELDSMCVNPVYNYTRDFVWIEYNEYKTEDELMKLQANAFKKNQITEDDLNVLLYIEAVDSTLGMRGVGYSVFEVFTNPPPPDDGDEEEIDIDHERVINFGKFKVPLHMVPIAARNNLVDRSYKAAPNIPCSSLLIRVDRMHRDKSNNLIKKPMVPVSQWEKLHGRKKNTQYQEIGEWRFVDKDLQLETKKGIHEKYEWKTARHILENLVKSTTKVDQWSYVLPKLNDRVPKNISSATINEKQKMLFQGNTKPALIIVPYIDSLGMNLSVESLVSLDEKTPSNSTVWFILVRLYKVAPGQSNNPDPIYEYICRRVNWGQTRPLHVVWKHEPVHVKDILRSPKTHDVVAVVRVFKLSNTLQLLQDEFAESALINVEAAIHEDSGHEEVNHPVNREEKSILNLIRLFGNNAKTEGREKMRKAIMAMTESQIEEVYNNQKMKSYVKVPPPKTKGSLQLEEFGWSVYSLLIDGSIIGTERTKFVRTGHFALPIIPGEFPPEVFGPLLGGTEVTQCLKPYLIKFKSNGALYMQVYDKQREYEQHYMNQKDTSVNRFAEYGSMHLANTGYFFGKIQSEKDKPFAYEQFLDEALIDAIEAAKTSSNKRRIIAAVRDQILNEVYTTLLAETKFDEAE